MKKCKYFTLTLVILILNNQAKSQTSILGNNGTAATQYLGWDVGTPFNLQIRHDGNFPICHFTDQFERMRLYQNNFISVDNSGIFNQGGFIGLSMEPTFFLPGTLGSYSLLHLNGNNNGASPQEFGYRSWMQPGITYTHNQDLMYVGPRRNQNDLTDAVIAWADNPAGSDVHVRAFT